MPTHLRNESVECRVAFVRVEEFIDFLTANGLDAAALLPLCHDAKLAEDMLVVLSPSDDPAEALDAGIQRLNLPLGTHRLIGIRGDWIQAPDEQAAAADPVRQKTTAPKASAASGDGRAKLVAALTAHHKYDGGCCQVLAPIGNNQLARLAGVSTSTASEFFQERFQGHGKYKALCRDAGRLGMALKLLNGEYSPHDLYGRRPPGDDDRDAS